MRGDPAMMGGGGLPRPGKALLAVLVTLLALWLFFALGINWLGLSPDWFLALAGSTEAVAHGQVWRLFTAALVHQPSGSIGHILTALIGLYFLAPSLESAWGPRRFLGFLALSAVFAYGLEFAVALALPASVGARLVPAIWFGALPVVEAVAIAWALSFKGRTVNLMFVLPISSTGLILVVIGFSVLALIAQSHSFEGYLAPFGGMLAGWLWGGGTPSPARRAWLRLRLRRLDAQAARDARRRKDRAARSGLRVIEGGREPDDDRRGPDGKWLN